MDGATCSNDPHFYQACGLGGKITNDHFLCEYYNLCEQYGGYVTSENLEVLGWKVCNGEIDCKKTGLDEKGCSDMTTLRSGLKAVSHLI